jgi:chromosome segregation ATPase
MSTLSFAQAQDHCKRIVAEMKSLKVLEDVLDTAVQAEGQLAALKAEREALLPEVARLKDEIAALGVGLDDKKAALQAQVQAIADKAAADVTAAQESAREAERAAERRKNELEADFTIRADALRVELASLTAARDSMLAQRDEAKARYDEFRRSIPAVA